MLVDWFTVGAQGLNFVILVWLMKRFLYKPILHAIDARENQIAAELADADARKAEAQGQRDTFRRKNEEFDETRAALLKQAKDEARAERKRLIEDAHRAASILSAKRDEALKRDAQNLYQAIGDRAQREVFAIARNALMDLAGANLEERIGEVFIRRLHEMDGPAKERLAQAIRTAPGPTLVRSALDLPASLREAIQHALNEISSAEVDLRFEVSPKLVGGVELIANGQKVAWSIAEYLRALEKGVGEVLQGGDKPKAEVESGGSLAESDREPIVPAKAKSA